MAPLQQALLRVAVQIFDRGSVTSEERLALASIHGSAGLTPRQLADVFESFVRITWGDVIDEEALTAEDWARLAMISRELRVPTHWVPFPEEVLDLAS